MTFPSAAALRLVVTALVALAVAAALAWTVLAIAHVDDRYRINQVSGARMALAQHANHGQLYPPLYDGHVYGGTRFMPVPILLHAGVSQMTGDYLVSGKVLGYLLLAALLAAVFVLLRHVRSQLPLALALTASLVVGDPGLSAGFDVRGEALPTLLQVAAVAVMAMSAGTAGAVVAAVLAALALMSKLTAIWAPVAVIGWLLLRGDRRRLLAFASTYGLCVLVLLGAFQLATSGRLLQNVVGLSLAGVGDLGSALTAPNRLLRTLFLDATVTWALLPVAALGVVIAARDRDLSVYEVGLVGELLILLGVFADIGTGVNQLLDLTVLVVLVVGRLAGRLVERRPFAPPGTARAAQVAAMGLLVVWVAGGALVTNLGPDVLAAAAAVRARGGPAVPPLAGWARRDTSLLSEDPFVPVALGQTPVVLDPFMLLRLEQRDPEAVADLAKRIDAREFDLVVLIVRLDDDEDWWRNYHFGETVIEAIRRSYVPAGEADGYYLYKPSPTRPG